MLAPLIRVWNPCVGDTHQIKQLVNPLPVFILSSKRDVSQKCNELAVLTRGTAKYESCIGQVTGEIVLFQPVSPNLRINTFYAAHFTPLAEWMLTGAPDLASPATHACPRDAISRSAFSRRNWILNRNFGVRHGGFHDRARTILWLAFVALLQLL